jgi:hypothetical protein
MAIVAMLAAMAGYITNLSYNQRLLAKTAGGSGSIVSFYHAKAGLVNASWRIRTNTFGGLTPPGQFTTDAWNPNPYNLDVNGDGTNDTTVDIGPVENPVLKNRRIVASGCENAVPC